MSRHASLDPTWSNGANLTAESLGLVEDSEMRFEADQAMTWGTEYAVRLQLKSLSPILTTVSTVAFTVSHHRYQRPHQPPPSRPSTSRPSQNTQSVTSAFADPISRHQWSERRLWRLGAS
jgi:hypothetical protein